MATDVPTTLEQSPASHSDEGSMAQTSCPPLEHDPVGRASRPPHGATDAHRRLERPAIRAAAIAAMLLSAAWAFMPLPGGDLFHLADVPGSQTTSAAEDRIALNIDAFRAPLWVAPPAPPPQAPAPRPPPPPPPLKLELLAITRDDAIHRAVLYDPDTDRIHIVATGDRVADRTIERVTEHAISIRTTHGLTTLTLRREGGRS